MLQRTDRHKHKTPPSYALKKRRVRKPRLPSPTPQAIFGQLRPKFLPFICEWEGCKAELQNMATLRRHVMVVHRRSEACRWGKCATKEIPVRFNGGGGFEDHVEESHLVPFQWHMGDGYKNTWMTPTMAPKGAQGNIPAYLFDKDGIQVTPSVEGQEVEDFVTWKNNRRRLRELLLQRDANAPLEDYPSVPD